MSPGLVQERGDSFVEEVPLHVIHLDQDDPRKCTARKMHANGLVEFHESISRAPRRGYLLDPKSPSTRGLISLRLKNIPKVLKKLFILNSLNFEKSIQT